MTVTDVDARPWLAQYPAEVPHSLAPYPERALHHYVRDAAERYGDRPAFLFYGAATSFRELDARVDRFAAALQALGVAKGDRVALMLPNCPQFGVAFYGALRAGATVLGLNPLYTPRELGHVLRDAGAETFVVLAPMLRVFDAVAAETPVRRVIVTGLDDAMPAPVAAGYVATARAAGTYAEVPAREGLYRYAELLAADRGAPAPVDVDVRRDVAVLQYTGGTTGTSKGAMLTHFNAVANALQTRAFIPQLADGEETALAIIPFFHIYGLTCALNLSIVAGGTTLALLPRFDAMDAIDLMARAGATSFPGVPAMFVGLNAALAADPSRASAFARLKLVNSGSAPLPIEVGREFAARTGLSITEGYGLSEASPTTHTQPPGRAPRDGTIGVPICDVECVVVDDDGRPVAPGAAGELCLRGPNVMLGYYNRPEETAAALRDHGDGGPRWLHTGDVAVMDPDGYFRIVDRKKDMILVGGFNVYPREIEEVLHEHPAVQEAAAYAAPDAYLGEVVRAAVVLRPGASATEEELVAHCRAGLAPFKTPRTIDLRDALPRSTVGKVLRRVLRDEAAAAGA
ncbi:long-chain-fatty-acid--CoA ligase [Gemmatimonadetes bacterium T265]|nr:long-chain-fatty-acid--CoA ligase [Gemmatimonadetes bacterium T265]